MSSSPHPEETQIPAEFALLAFDMEKYSQIPEAKMESTRSDVDDIVANVLADCGLPDPQELTHAYKDGGDGAILLFPPDALARIIDPLLGRLSAALGRYDQQRLASSPLVRLRIAVHAGPVTGPELRSGNALVDVRRLLDSQAVRQALKSAADTGGFLAGVLSETAYQRCVHGGYTPQLTPQHFLRATAQVSNKPDYQALSPAPRARHAGRCPRAVPERRAGSRCAPSFVSPARAFRTFSGARARRPERRHPVPRTPVRSHRGRAHRTGAQYLPAPLTRRLSRPVFTASPPWSPPMPETPFDPDRPHPPADESNAAAPAPHGWKSPWRRHQDAHDDSGYTSTPADPPDTPSTGQDDKPAVYAADGAIHLHRHVDVVAQHIDEVILETRKRDVLEGDVQDRGALLQQPFVRSEHWTEVWDQALHPGAAGLRQPVLIMVAPRSFGSTTFALRLLAEQTDGHTTLVKLDADWSHPSRGRLPLEKDHAYQLDLKHPVNDALSADFLNSLSKHADNLRDARSSLVLTVAQDLWTDHHVGERSGIHVLRLRHAPDAQSLIEARLDTNGYSQLVNVLRSSAKAQASVRGLSAVGAARAARTAVEALHEHLHLGQQPGQPAAADGIERLTLVQRVEAALTDWRVELDSRFGESTARHSSDNSSLTLEDRCLLLALAVWQSAPMPQVTRSASKLQESIASSPRRHGNTLPGAQRLLQPRTAPPHHGRRG